jgi:hypothetical protein
MIEGIWLFIEFVNVHSINCFVSHFLQSKHKTILPSLIKQNTLVIGKVAHCKSLARQAANGESDRLKGEGFWNQTEMASFRLRCVDFVDFTLDFKKEIYTKIRLYHHNLAREALRCLGWITEV